MLAWIWPLSSFAAALVFLQTNFAEQLRSVEILFGAVPIGLLSSTWIVFLSSATWYYTLDERSIWVCCVIQWVYLIWFAVRWSLRAISGRQRGAYKERSLRKRNFWVEVCSGRLSVWALALFAIALFCCWPIYSAHFTLEDVDGEWKTSGGSWGDIPLHLHLLTSFLYGSNKHFWYGRVESPISAGKLLAYPFLCDFHAAALVVGGFSWRNALRVPSLLLSASCVPLLFLLGERLTGSIGSALLSLGLLIWSGGTGYVEFAFRYGWKRLIFPEADDDPIQINGIGNGADIFWFGFLGQVMAPQRSIAFALPAALVSFLLLTASLDPGTDLDTSAHSIFWAAVLAGVLPLFHAHLYAAAGMIGAMLCVLDMQRWRRSPGLLWRGWIPGLLVFAGIGAPQILFYFDRIGSEAYGTKFTAFAPETVAGFNGNFWRTWLRALGIQVPLYLSSMALLVFEIVSKGASSKSRMGRWRDAICASLLPACCIRKDGRWRLKLVLPFASLFVLANVIRFQPWEKDNIKIFYVWLIQASAWNAALLMQLYARLERQPWGRMLLTVSIVSTMMSGFLAMRKEMAGLRVGHIDIVASQVGEWIREYTPPNAVFLTGESNHFSPPACIAGRALYIGPGCFTLTHGIPGSHDRYSFRYFVYEGTLDDGTSVLDALRSRFINYVLFEPDMGPPDFGSTDGTESIRLVLEHHGWRLFEIHDVPTNSRPMEEIPRSRLIATFFIMVCGILAACLLRHESNDRKHAPTPTLCANCKRTLKDESEQTNEKDADNGEAWHTWPAIANRHSLRSRNPHPRE
ncbi:hypothetical protein F1559_003087 [Cyanidiococcus yangmingshanensis]|uniref:Uncharacterized protein n=1 Tax=Cyanidiococcus yangmingshanensis TaxID=2690220 RepID=A0A7J7IPB7_9RHOD|nr:hypothetical protein F1559_003087 [Cyanidiococcus yangmingshanensis]